jgi:methionyl-tRNA formyltransferase
MQAKRFGSVKSITLIGGGDLMLDFVAMARAVEWNVNVVLAPRFEGETLPICGRVTGDAFRSTGARVVVIDDINQLDDHDLHHVAGPDAVAICFGPAWIFAERVRAAFGHGMINFNGIPIPRYLGGAHYTWQILNGDRSGGCFLQEISGDLDRGHILRGERFSHSTDVRTPWDYFVANHDRGVDFMNRAVKDMSSDADFPRRAWDEINAERLYFPRLHTLENGWIDWSWSASEIERFCCAFDRPYAGAGTFYEGEEVRFSDVRLESDDALMHPFCAGLVVRKTADQLVVACRGGALKLGVVKSRAGSDVRSTIREGRRFNTPQPQLERARTWRPQLSAKGFVTGSEPPKT